MRYLQLIILCFTWIMLQSCGHKPSPPSAEVIGQLGLKRGDIISCGAPGGQFGSVDFGMTCDSSVKKDFNLAIELLHSFEYDEAEKMFAKIITVYPACAMAYWGVAMCNFHPLWTPPSEAELIKGKKALDIAMSIANQSTREKAYINALELFYTDWDKKDHHTRCVLFEKAMESLHSSYASDNEAAIFYALALDASAIPTDKTYANQKKAAAILNTLYAKEPNHPGIIHYLIHTYDYPGLAAQGLEAAEKYAAVAPSSAHALHMPSHIFTRLGLWDEVILSNLQSVDAARCYAEQAKIAGHWDEELHGLDYLEYAYLQKGDNQSAKHEIDYLDSIKSVYPVNFKVAYAFAAIPSRYVLENKLWKQAAVMALPQKNFSWSQFPWQEAIVHFTRLIGAAHIQDIAMSEAELKALNRLRDTLVHQKDSYKANQVSIQITAGEAWIAFANDKRDSAITRMQLAATMEDNTEKHPVTPGEVIPARELLADMLLEDRQYKTAEEAYERILQKSPNRFNSLYGAGLAAEKSGDNKKASEYFLKLLSQSGGNTIQRPELSHAMSFTGK
ncbi:MAG: tetratricopeptide repeat protein [Chitinophagaceae bacterium]